MLKCHVMLINDSNYLICANFVHIFFIYLKKVAISLYLKKKQNQSWIIVKVFTNTKEATVQHSCSMEVARYSNSNNKAIF